MNRATVQRLFALDNVCLNEEIVFRAAGGSISGSNSATLNAMESFRGMETTSHSGFSSTNVPLLLLSSSSSSSSTDPLSWSLLVTLIFSYVLIVNIIFWYKFVSAWNLIARTHRRFDLTLSPWCRRQTQRIQETASSYLVSWLFGSSNVGSTSSASYSYLYAGESSFSASSYTAPLPALVCLETINMSCPICLNDFTEEEKVTACEESSSSSSATAGGGCGTYFHNDCLVEWLNRYSDSCPCCRKDLVSPSLVSSSSSSPSSFSNTSLLYTRPSPGWMTDLSVFLGYGSQS